MIDNACWSVRRALLAKPGPQLISGRQALCCAAQAFKAVRSPCRETHGRRPRLACQAPFKAPARHMGARQLGENHHQRSPLVAALGGASALPDSNGSGDSATTANQPQPSGASLEQSRDSAKQPTGLSSFSLSRASTSVRPPALSRLQLALSTATFALPLAAQNILGYSLNALSESLVGRLGPSSLSASTLANSSYSLAGLSLVWGGAAGMETLCGQAYGAGNLRLMRLVLIRAVLVCWAVCVPVVALWGNAEPLLHALGQSPELVAQAAVYLRALAPAMYWYILTECLQVYLVVQGAVRPTVVAKAVVTLLGPLFYYACMFWLDLGLVGAGYAYGLCKGANALLLLGYVAWRWMRGEATAEGAGDAGEGRGGAAAVAAVTGTSAGEAVGPGGSGAQTGATRDAPGAASSSSNGSGKRTGRLNVQGLVYGVSASGRTRSGGSGGTKDDDSRQRTAAAAVFAGAGRSGYVGIRPNAHEEVLTSPLSAAASAHEFSIGTATRSAAAAANLPQRVAFNAGAAPAAASAAVVAMAGAGQQAAAEAGVGLYDRLRAAAAAVHTGAVEVLDPRACLEYVKFGLPAAVMSCLEWWAYEALVIMAGWLPDANVSLGCLGICLTVSGWVYMVPQAISSATCARVSNALGAGDAALAKRTFQSAYCLVLLTQLAISCCLLPNAARVASFFCPDPVAAALTSTLLPITAINVIGDGLNAVLNGILRACGRQSLGARLHLLAYWCCGLPAAYFAAFHGGLGVKGFVVAIGATSFIQSLVVGTVISRFDWEGEVRNSQTLLSTISSTSSGSSLSSVDGEEAGPLDPSIAATLAAAAESAGANGAAGTTAAAAKAAPAEGDSDGAGKPGPAGSATDQGGAVRAEVLGAGTPVTGAAAPAGL